MDFSIIKTGTAGAAALQYFNNRISNAKDMYYQLLPGDLIAQAVELGEGVLSDTGPW